MGESYLVQAIGRQLIRDGHLYRNKLDGILDVLRDEAFEGLDRIMNPYLKPKFLILNDIGMKRLQKGSGESLFEIIVRRLELRSTMMTCNRPLED